MEGGRAGGFPFLKLEKPAFHAACHHQSQEAETRTESLWALYSDARDLKRLLVMYPNRPSYISSQAGLSYKKKKSVGTGLGIEGEVNQINAAVGDFSGAPSSVAVTLYLHPGRLCSLPGVQPLRFHPI